MAEKGLTYEGASCSGNGENVGAPTFKVLL
jgi:hypothetical protein